MPAISEKAKAIITAELPKDLTEAFDLEECIVTRTLGSEVVITMRLADFPDTRPLMVQYDEAAIFANPHRGLPRLIRRLRPGVEQYRRDIMTGRIRDPFWEELLAAAMREWKGSPTFASTVAGSIYAASTHRPAVEALWRLRGGVPFSRLVSNVGYQLCAIDAAQVNGRRLRASRVRTAERVLMVALGKGLDLGSEILKGYLVHPPEERADRVSALYLRRAARVPDSD